MYTFRACKAAKTKKKTGTTTGKIYRMKEKFTVDNSDKTTIARSIPKKVPTKVPRI
jgi:hypothetical protein